MSISRYDLQDFHINLTHHNARLLYVSQERFAGDWHGIGHTHSCCEFFYVVEGDGFFSIENQTYSVSANDLVVINPNILHTEIGDEMKWDEHSPMQGSNHRGVVKEVVLDGYINRYINKIMRRALVSIE